MFLEIIIYYFMKVEISSYHTCNKKLSTLNWKKCVTSTSFFLCLPIMWKYLTKKKNQSRFCYHFNFEICVLLVNGQALGGLGYDFIPGQLKIDQN